MTPLAVLPPAPARRGLSRPITLAALAAGLGCRVAAAQGAPADSLVGRVRGAGGTALPATVRAVVGADRARYSTRADSAGRFLLVLPARPDGYVVVVEHLGYTPETLIVPPRPGHRWALGDVQLRRVAAPLDTVRVRDRRRVSAPTRRTPGDHGGEHFSLTTDLLPLEGGSLADIARLTPGVGTTADSSGHGLVIAGQPPSQSGVTLDGASYGGAAVPEEAVRATTAFTSTYDVSRGQFSGGQFAVTTRRGTNVWSGVTTAVLRAPWLQYGTVPAARSTNRSPTGSSAAAAVRWCGTARSSTPRRNSRRGRATSSRSRSVTAWVSPDSDFMSTAPAGSGRCSASSARTGPPPQRPSRGRARAYCSRGSTYCWASGTRPCFVSTCRGGALPAWA